jgi:hypothetical protein
MRRLRQSAVTFVLGLLFLLSFCTPSQAQNQSLRANSTSVRPAPTIPTRFPGTNAFLFPHHHFAHLNGMHVMHSPFRHQFFRDHERLEHQRRLAWMNSYYLGSYLPYTVTPYSGGYVNLGYGTPYLGGGYINSYRGYPSSYGGYPSSYGGYPSFSGGYGSSGYSAQSYPSYSNSQMPSYSGQGTSYSVPSYAPDASALYQTPPAGTNKSKDGQASGKDNTNPSKGLESKDTDRILTSVGVPTYNGQLSYPLGLKILQPSAENLQLLDQIETLFQLLAMQQAGGQVNANLAQEAKVGIDRLQTMLRGRQHNMMPNTYEEAQQYLEKLRHGLQVLQPAT